jgi:hypothetical protein
MRSGYTLSGGIIPPASSIMCDLLVHDIRSVLAIIHGYAQLLQRRLANCRPDPDDVVQGLQRVETAAGHAVSLLEKVARLVDRDDLCHLEPRHMPVDLVALAVRVSEQTPAGGHQRVAVLPSVPELVGAWDGPRPEELVGRRPGEGHIRSIQRRVEYNTLVNVRKD